MTDYMPDDGKRCQFLWSNGNRCRELRAEGEDLGFCRYHHDRVVRESRTYDETWPAWIADEVLPPNAKLDSASAVNDTLTRLLRVALQGHIPVRSAGSLGYVVQHILTTLPGLHREATGKPKHPILGRDPDAAIAQLADTLHHNLRGPGSNGQAASPATGEAPAAEEPEEVKPQTSPDGSPNPC